MRITYDRQGEAGEPGPCHPHAVGAVDARAAALRRRRGRHEADRTTQEVPH